MTEIPIIGARASSERTIRIRRSDGIWMQVKAPRAVNLEIVKRAFADCARNDPPMYLTQAEAEFMADVISQFEVAGMQREAARKDAETKGYG